MEHIDNVKMIGMCSSHIDNITHLNELNNMLQSWNNQTFKIKLILSISFNHEIEMEIDNMFKKYSSLIVVKSDKKSQFEHYKSICEKYIKKYKNYNVCLAMIMEYGVKTEH